MLRSMTGFAAKTVALAIDAQSKTTITIQLKSLNSRYFEVTCKMPYQMSALEIDITRVLQEKLHRGHLYFTAYTNNADAFKGTVEPSLTALEGYINALKRIKATYPISGDITVSDLLAIPNIFTTEEKMLDESNKKIIFDTIAILINEVIAAQIKEGAALTHDIEKRIANMQRDITTIEHTSGTLMEAQKAKVSKTLQEVTGDTNALADIQKHAAYVLLDKMDINEEIVRFKSHLKNLAALLGTDAIEKGKRLDFTLQEMAREINTVAAKCSDATIGSLAINIKVELEKAREQTQNIV
jgi:uncharacterized protein (TIGR00255 family)